MLTTKQKREHFVKLRARNYRASLQLEGFDVQPTKLSVEAEPESVQARIASLKRRYAR